MAFFHSSAQASLRLSNALVFTILYKISQTTPRHLLEGTISFPEERIVFSLIVGL